QGARADRAQRSGSPAAGAAHGPPGRAALLACGGTACNSVGQGIACWASLCGTPIPWVEGSRSGAIVSRPTAAEPVSQHLAVPVRGVGVVVVGRDLLVAGALIESG